MEKRPYLTVRVPAIILTCPITTMLIVDHARHKTQFYGAKNAYDPMEYMLIMNLLVCLCQTQQRNSAATARDIAKNNPN